MGRKYTKVEELTAAIRARRAAEETKRTIGKSCGLSKSSLNKSLNVQKPERANAGGIAAKFSIRNQMDVKLKCHVIERFRGKYSTEAMCKAFEENRSGYYAW